jgi:hypothetical protein
MQLRQNGWPGCVRGSITLRMLPDAYRMEYEFDQEGLADTCSVVDRTSQRPFLDKSRIPA